MKKLILILLLIPIYLVAQDFRIIDWKTNVDNVQIMGVDTFQFEIDPIDYNDKGVGEIGNYFIDYAARAFKIIDSDATTITVVDLEGVNEAPQQNQIGRVYQSIIEGDTLFKSIGGVDISVLDDLSKWKAVARDNELFGRAINSKLSNPVEYLRFDTSAILTHRPYSFMADTLNRTIVMYNDEAEISMQLGMELWAEIKNGNGSTFENGRLVYIMGTDGGKPVVMLANSTDYEQAEAVGMITHDVESGTFGFMATYGNVGGLNTLGEIAGGEVYLDTLGYWTTTIPTFPKFQMEMGYISNVSATEGRIFINPKGRLKDILDNQNNANIVESFDFRSSSDGVTITGELTSTDGKDYLTIQWSDGFSKISVPTIITIPQGTSNLSQTSYIYIPKSTGVLTTSTSYFPDRYTIQDYC